jgi:mannose-6-phosphate isomerase-like protein (cupin superfamily)
MQRVKESEQEYRDVDSGVKYLMRGPKVDWGVILLKPDRWLGGHYHKEVEEIFYFLEGQGKVYVNGTEYAIEAGDAVRMEASDKHDIHNDGDQPLKMVFIKAPYLPKDKVEASATE